MTYDAETFMFGRNTALVGFAFLTITGPSVLTQPQQTPAFRTGVDAVRLDLRVVDEKGAFVRGVVKDELRVFEDGVEQAVSTLSMVELPAADTAAPAWPSDVATNASFANGRVYLLLLDDLHIHELRAVTVRQLARRFVEQYTTPADRIAIATASGIGLTSQHFTNNRTDLVAAIDQFKPRTLPEGIVDDLPQFAGVRAEGPADAPKPTRDSKEVLPLQWLLSSVDWLSTIPDRRKAMVFISEGVLDRSSDPDVEGTLREITSAASRANVAIYSVDAHGLPSAPSGAVKPVDVDDGNDVFSDRRRRLEAGLATLAEQTGGASVIRSNGFDALFERVVADSSAYYVLGYTSTHPPGRRPRQVEVRISRPGLAVHSRRAVGPVSARAARRATTPQGLPSSLGEAFQSPVPITDVALAVTAAPRRGSGDRASVAVVVEGQGTHPLDMFLAAADGRGEVQASKRGALKVDGDGRMQATATLQLKPGRYHLRVAAVQPETGARGSVMYDVSVPDFSKEDLSLGGLVVMDTARRRSPTTRRSFAASESFDVGAEVYWRRGLNEPIAIGTTVTNEAGAVVYRQDGIVDPSERPNLGVDMGTTVHLERLDPGAYRLTIEAKTSGKRALITRRELPFVVSAR
jgi:VWFA-related protein